jgi:DNA gyrase subunit A
LDKALARAHILEGLIIALIISMKSLRLSAVLMIFGERLMERFELSEIRQKRLWICACADCRGLEREKIDAEYKELTELIEYLQKVWPANKW